MCNSLRQESRISRLFIDKQLYRIGGSLTQTYRTQLADHFHLTTRQRWQSLSDSCPELADHSKIQLYRIGGSLMQTLPHTTGGSLLLKPSEKDGKHSQTAVHKWQIIQRHNSAELSDHSCRHYRTQLVDHFYLNHQTEITISFRQLSRIGRSFRDTTV